MKKTLSVMGTWWKKGTIITRIPHIHNICLHKEDINFKNYAFQFGLSLLDAISFSNH